MKDGFESVFHKVKEGYEIQNEVRFAVINPDKPEHMELMLEKDLELKFTLIPLRYGKDILIELSNLEFDDKLNLLIILGLSEPPVRTLRATIPEVNPQT